jgi:hypothetical protein
MKKTLLTCLAIVAVFAVASSASAITCTIDQRPAATLLVPYFQVSYDDAGNLVSTGVGARDTIVTIGNASSSPMIAHVNVYDRFSELVLDFNVALTGFDLQAMRISDIIGGNLPNTPLDVDGEPLGDVCQRADPDVYPDPDGFIRVFPLVPATTLDNTLATTEYNQQFFSVAEQLRRDCFDDLGPLAIGYIVIDHANYCNLSDPTDPNYYYNNALGNENNLFGEIIFTSGLGIPTYALSTVNIEADSAIAVTAGFDITRTFYARYWEPAITGIPYLPANNCPNCPGTNDEFDLAFTSPWNIPGGAEGAGIGDGREPLGLKWAARWFDLGLTITSNFRAWRSSTFNPDSDGCDVLLPQMASTFYDEDEQTTTSGVCPSPCTQEQFNFPLETQQENIIFFIGAFPGAPAGWVAFDFNTGSSLDQAWVDYAFEGALAFETVLVPGTQLDPSSCNPIGVTGVELVTPAVPSVPTGTGPFAGQ